MSSVSPLDVLIALGNKMSYIKGEGIFPDPGELMETDSDFRILMEAASSCFRLFEELSLVAPMNVENVNRQAYYFQLSEVVQKYL